MTSAYENVDIEQYLDDAIGQLIRYSGAPYDCILDALRILVTLNDDISHGRHIDPDAVMESLSVVLRPEMELHE